MNFTNKVVLITGAGSGIGKAIALKFAKLSATLSLIDINKNSLDKVAQECETVSKKVFKVVTDLSNTKNVKDAVTDTIQAFDRLDVVVNCAGISSMDGITDINILEVLNKVLAINLISHIAATHYAVEALIKSEGCIVNISSIFATNAIKKAISYAVSKAGMVHFTKCAALELAEKGVRVNSISPGPVRTNLVINELKCRDKSDKLFGSYEEQSPLKRLATAEEIAEMVVFLASDKAKSITGVDVKIDSGLTLQ